MNLNNIPSRDLHQKLQRAKIQFDRIKEGREALKEDRSLAQQHMVALARKENNQEPERDQEMARQHIRDNYDAFFEEEVEDSDPEVETSPEYKERKQVKEVINYLNEELQANATEQAKVASLGNRIKEVLMARNYNPAAEASNTSDPVGQSDTLASNEQSAQSNVQTGQSPSDYIDSLPKDYNPLDDLGDD